MKNDKNYKELLKNLLPTIRKINEIEKQKNNMLISILEENIQPTEQLDMVYRGIYKEPYQPEKDYLCNLIYFNQSYEKPCPLTGDRCEYLTKLMGNDLMPCEVLYLKLKNESIRT